MKIQGIKSIITLLSAAALMLVMSSCVHTHKNSPGFEYMPDMYRSPAIEPYVDYGQIRDTIHPELQNRLSARHPADSTIPFSEHIINDLPDPYPGTPQGYTDAGLYLHNPLKVDSQLIARGKVLFDTFCFYCHGKSGHGDGPVVKKGGFPPPPAYNGPLKDLPEGKIYHTITYGKGLMGSHASQLSKIERWEIVSYVQTLQHPGGKKASSSATSATTDKSQANK